MEGEGKIKVVHRNLLLPLFSDPLDQIDRLNNISLIDHTGSRSPTIGTQETPTELPLVVGWHLKGGVIASHVHNLSTYGRVRVSNMLQRGLEFVTALLE